MPKLVDHQRRRAAIADAALDVIAGGGLDAAGLREVARRSDVTTGAITHYFADKAALLDAAYEAAMARVIARQAEVGRADPALLPQALASFLPTDDEAIREWRVWLAFSARAAVEPRLRERHGAHYTNILNDFAAALAAGGLPSGRAAIAADALVAVLDGVAIRMLLEPGGWPAERIEAILAAVAAPLLEDGR